MIYHSEGEHCGAKSCVWQRLGVLNEEWQLILSRLGVGFD